jgi:protein O-GlcNAc transferase
VLNNVGNLMTTLRQWETARQCFQRAIELNPHSSAAFANLGALLADCSQDYEQAIRYCSHAVELNPQNASAFHKFGLVLMQLEHYEEAEYYFERAN